MALRVAYALGADGDLSIRYTASVSRPTVLNLTNHALLQPRGRGALGRSPTTSFRIDADRFLPVDDDIPAHRRDTSRRRHAVRLPRAALPRRGHPRRRPADHARARLRSLLRARLATALAAALRRAGPPSRSRGGRSRSSPPSPASSCNSGNVLSGRFAGDSGRTYRQSDGFCLEAQQFPDAPNRPDFPSCVGDARHRAFSAQTVYRLGLAP